MRKFYTMQSLLLLFLLLAVLLSACGKQEPSAPDAVSSPTAENSDTDRGQETTGDTTESSAALPAESGTTNGILEISFDFVRGTTPASSQFAVWIEDSSGNLVKTLYVTNFTANGGYAKRKESIPTWVSKAKPSVLTETELDAISGATPQAGRLSYSWDGTDENGNTVAEGSYTLYLEGTLYWTSSILLHGDFEYGGEEMENIPLTADYTEDEPTNRDMVTNVSARYFWEK